MTTTIVQPAKPAPSLPREELPDGPALAAQVCPTCGERIIFMRCEGVCRSAKCIYRVVLTCTDC